MFWFSSKFWRLILKVEYWCCPLPETHRLGETNKNHSNCGHPLLCFEKLEKVGFLIIDIQIYKEDKAKIMPSKMASKKHAEKLKSCEMKDEGWMKNDEGWKMNDEGGWFQAVEGFCWLTDKQTNRRTFVIVESLSRLKKL